jgi:hypothetical protein
VAEKTIPSRELAFLKNCTNRSKSTSGWILQVWFAAPGWTLTHFSSRIARRPS